MPFVGHKWAAINLTALSQILRHVAAHPEEARAKGVRARQDVLKFYSKEAIGNQIIQRLHQISNIVDAREARKIFDRQRLDKIKDSLAESTRRVGSRFY